MICYCRNGDKRGYMVANEYDGIALSYPHAETGHRGRVAKGIAHTLTSAGRGEGIMVNGRIRKLTPRECFALQGFRKEDADMLSENGLSDSQLYKQAGNSICVPVLVAIFGAMREQGLFLGFGC